MLVRQLEEEVVKTRAHAKETNPEIKAHIEGLQMENDHLTREVAILKETTKVCGKCINTNAMKRLLVWHQATNYMGSSSNFGLFGDTSSFTKKNQCSQIHLQQKTIEGGQTKYLAKHCQRQYENPSFLSRLWWN